MLFTVLAVNNGT